VRVPGEVRGGLEVGRQKVPFAQPELVGVVDELEGAQVDEAQAWLGVVVVAVDAERAEPCRRWDGEGRVVEGGAGRKKDNQ